MSKLAEFINDSNNRTAPDFGIEAASENEYVFDTLVLKGLYMECVHIRSGSGFTFLSAYDSGGADLATFLNQIPQTGRMLFWDELAQLLAQIDEFRSLETTDEESVQDWREVLDTRQILERQFSIA